MGVSVHVRLVPAKLGVVGWFIPKDEGIVKLVIEIGYYLSLRTQIPPGIVQLATKSSI